MTAFQDREALAPFRAALSGGQPFRAALEVWLASLEAEPRDRVMQCLREARGAWVGAVRAPLAGADRALFVGDPLSGAVPALAAAGWRVIAVDPRTERLHFALARAAAAESAGSTDAAAADGDLLGAVCGGLNGLPFRDGSFDLVALEDGPGAPRGATLDEARRVARNELFLCVDNRLGYKRSSGRTRDFRVLGPLELLRRVLGPGPKGADRTHTLRGWRRRLAHADWEPVRAFALYPDRRDFAYVAALDSALPALFVGPSERKNRAKLAARALGLVPMLTPSFGLRVARRTRSAPALTERVLAGLARELGLAEAPELEHLVATRGNVAVWLTRPPAASRPRAATGPRARPEPPECAPPGSCAMGSWALHVLLAPHHRAALATHVRILERLRGSHPSVPVPRPLFAGRVAGRGPWLTCEERVPGHAAHHGLAHENHAALLDAVADHLAALVEPQRSVFDDAAFERLVAARTARISARVGPTARTWLAELAEQARDRLVGRPLPLALQHGDLRPKHVQLDRERRVIGYFDWATSRVGDLPLLDLIHFGLHAAKQLAQADGDPQSEARLWEQLRERLDGADAAHGARPPRPHATAPGTALVEPLAAALERYARSARLDAHAVSGLVGCYPAWVGWVAETFWPYSRPGWFDRLFGL